MDNNVINKVFTVSEASCNLCIIRGNVAPEYTKPNGILLKKYKPSDDFDLPVSLCKINF